MNKKVYKVEKCNIDGMWKIKGVGVFNTKDEADGKCKELNAPLPPGRPVKGDEPCSKMFCVMLTENQMIWLNNTAIFNGVSKAEILKSLIEKEMDNNEG